MEVCLCHSRRDHVLLWRLSKALDQLLSGSCGEIVLSSVNSEYQQKRHCVKLASSVFPLGRRGFSSGERERRGQPRRPEQRGRRAAIRRTGNSSGAKSRQHRPG